MWLRTVALHDLEELNNHLAHRADQHLLLAPLLRLCSGERVSNGGGKSIKSSNYLFLTFFYQAYELPALLHGFIYFNKVHLGSSHCTSF